MKPEANLTPGTIIGGYRIDGLIGQGGMAQVYKAWNTGLHRHEALKLLPPQMTFDHSFVERFLHEARTAASLRHPHIATIHTVSPTTEAQPYFTMEMVQGEDLADLLHNSGSLPLQEALPVLRQIAAALDYAHSHGIIHRDVKPANILLEDDGRGGWNVKVVDFGIARAQEAGDGARLTKTGMIVGTPEYMSPEQGGSGAKVDHRSDQYSLGVIAYEMLCGRPPFAVGAEGTAMTVIMSHIRDVPRAPVDFVPNLSQSANSAVLRALSKKPEDRFASCAEFVAALEAPTAVERPISSASNAVAQRKPPRLVPLMIGGAVVLGAGLIGFGLLRNTNNQDAVSPVGTTTRPLSTDSVPVLHEVTGKPNINAAVAKGAGDAQPKKIAVARLPATPVTQVSNQGVADLISKWLTTQNERQVASYASLYAPDFVGIKRTSHGRQTTYHLAAWLRDRGNMLTSADHLNISISNQEIVVHPGGAQVSFNQYFKTSKYGDWGPKVLQVRNTPEGLRIYREEMLGSYPLK